MTVARSFSTALTRVADHVQRALGWLLVVVMGVMVVDVTWQVVSRFLLRAPSSVTEELAGYLLIWIGVLGAAHGFRTRSHLGIDLLVSRLRGEARRTAAVAAHIVVAAFALSSLVIGGALLVRLAFQMNQISAALGVNVGFVYLALPLSGVVIVLFSIESITDVVSAGGPS